MQWVVGDEAEAFTATIMAVHCWGDKCYLLPYIVKLLAPVISHFNSGVCKDIVLVMVCIDSSDILVLSGRTLQYQYLSLYIQWPNQN